MRRFYRFALEVPRLSGAVDVLLYGKVLKVNRCRANDQPFINVAGFGFDVDVLDSVELFKAGTKSGRLANLKGLFHALGHFHLRQVE